VTTENLLKMYLHTDQLMLPLPDEHCSRLALALGPITNTKIYPASITAVNHSLLFLGNRLGKKYLGVISSISGLVDQFEEPEREAVLEGVKLRVRMGPAISRNAVWLRKILPFLAPQVIGGRKSAGCGDRLGLATPGHVRAIRKAGIALFSLSSHTGK
jgi:hypothetical protein